MQFMKNAKELARNPLGIIALFISLIYGFASLLLNSSADKLTEVERWPLIAFIVIFPLLVLGVFYRLVTHHHGKLYAPGDYHKDRSFMRTLSPSEQEARLTAEVRDSLGEEDGDERKAGAAQIPVDDADVAQLLHDDSDDTPLTSPAGGAVISHEMSREKMTREHRHELRALKTALVGQIVRESAAEPSGEVRHDVQVGATRACFDAVFAGKASTNTFVDVRVLKHHARAERILDSILYEALIAQRALEDDFRLVVVVVIYGDADLRERLQSRWQPRVSHCPADVELRVLRRDDVRCEAA
ncbi:hypothetical protein [Cobetia sp. QF-1]|uniref:hypothetical protein n=1 Tax=Cobetia sp. QF-1 TaxID=1969833 RepID=UPI000B53AEE3|nr:hypothetical protein [Cobetia sp. QF-1]